MGCIDKILTKMRNNPRDWRIEQLETVTSHFGISVRKSGGSHVVFEHPNWLEMVTVPAHRPIKPFYVKRFIAQIDTLEVNYE